MDRDVPQHQHERAEQLPALMRAAAESAASAMEQLIGRAVGRPEALQRISHHYVDLAFALELEFIFPGLTREQRDILVSLMKVRNGLQVQFGGLKQWRTRSDWKSHTEAVRNLKVDFLRLRTQLERSEMAKQLDPLQQRILREELLSLPPDKTESTTFFRRRKVTGTLTMTAPGATLSSPEDAPAKTPPPSKSKKEPAATEVRSALVEASATCRSPARRDHDLRRLGETDKKLLIVTPKREDYRPAIVELSAAGYRVRIAPDLKNALECVIDNPPDLVILDLALPAGHRSPGGDESGASYLLKGLGLMTDDEQSVVVGVCEANVAKPRKSEVDGYPLAAVLQKPIDPQRLFGAICVALDDTRVESRNEVPAQSVHALAK